jgi:hypothetical protein
MCKETFATPNAFFGHRRMDGACRPVETLIERGFYLSPKGWVFRKPGNKGEAK